MLFSQPAVGSQQEPKNDLHCHKNGRRRINGKLSFYCRMLGVSRQGFYKYLAHKDRPWKYQDLADAIRAINTEDEYNDTYGRIRMYQALLLKKPEGLKIPSERTVYRVMDEIGLSH